MCSFILTAHWRIVFVGRRLRYEAAGLSRNADDRLHDMLNSEERDKDPRKYYAVLHCNCFWF